MSSIIILSLILLILLYALFHKTDVFGAFLEGAKEGLQTSVQILPVLVGLLTAIGMLQASGLMDLLSQLLAPVVERLGIPSQLTPLMLLKPVSGSGSMAVCEELLTQFHPDTTIGRIAAVMQGSTETTFYTLAVYYGAVGVTNTRYTLPAALLADLTGMICAGVFVRLLF